jgi:hypothetical protein
MGGTLQRVRDQAEALEREVETLWPSPAGAVAELDATAHELTRLRAEIAELDGPERHRLSLFVSSCILALSSLAALAGWLVASGR